ncbi:hypothetical protein FS837_003865, partial [Tulasnella sp. UAMH 9824]
MTDNLLLYNYADDDTTATDTALTALFASTVSEPDHYGDIVDAARSTGNLREQRHDALDNEGWATP